MNYLFFLFCFLNLYGPFSTNITLVFNVLLFLCVYTKRTRVAYERMFVIVPLLLLIISIFSFVFTRSTVKDYSVIGTYARMLINCATIPAILTFFFQRKTDVLSILSLTLFLHCLMVLLQMIFPSLQNINPNLFRFERDEEILENLAMRRLGLTGGYDVSGFYTSISALISIELYFLTGQKKYSIISIVSLISSFFTSRTGMTFAFLSLFLSILLNTKRLSKKMELSVVYVIILGLSLFYIILPLLLRSFGIGGIGEDTTVAVEGTGYGEKTGVYLFEYHLIPLKSLNYRELIWGYGCSVRKSTLLWYYSDIGYVKQIYQVGIVGVALMVYFAILMVIKTYSRRNKVKRDLKMRIGSQLMSILLIIYLFFNYKNHLLYSICSFEVFLFVYYYFYCHFHSQRDGLKKISLR